MFIKSLSALIIIALGQVNFFSQSQKFLFEKISESNQKNSRNPYLPKEDKDAKKLVASNSHKQLFSRIKNFKTPNLKTVLSVQNEIIVFKKLGSEFKKINYAALPNAFDFNAVRLVLFGCC
jgi:hypothetical protein